MTRGIWYTMQTWIQIQYGQLSATLAHSSWLQKFCTAPICVWIFMFLDKVIFSGDGINTTEEEIEDMTSKSKPPGRVKIH